MSEEIKKEFMDTKKLDENELDGVTGGAARRSHFYRVSGEITSGQQTEEKKKVIPAGGVIC